MDNIKHALVLTGDVMPGFDAASVWPALAAYFRMEPERLRSELLARAPISIKESDDLAKLQNLQSGAAAAGALTELHAIGADGSFFVLVDNTPRGPVPHSLIEERVRSGAWPSNISVAAVGSASWRPFIAAAGAPVARAPSVDQQATVAFSALGADQASLQNRPADLRASTPETGGSTPVGATPASGPLLPESGAIHAGFWRRVAAYVADSVIVSIVLLVVSALIAAVAASMISRESAGLAVAFGFLGYVLIIVITWLYFAKFESSAGQATPGKRLMGLKVTDDTGRRISFGRATGRFFGKIISGLIFNIGYMLAGWTGRKQALHDMLAGTCVVFREVEPGRPLPTVRPPMPWYGWLLNILPFVGFAIMLVCWTLIMTWALGLAGTNYSNSDFSNPDLSSIVDNSTPKADTEAVRAGLSAITAEVETAKAEVAQAIASGGECPSAERSSSNAWIETIQLGGAAPECSVTVRLSSSSSVPFAARIERIEWTHAGDGSWKCASSMDSSLLPWPCE